MKYEMGIDYGAGRDGKNVLSIKSAEKNINVFGTLAKVLWGAGYRNTRIRMTGEMKTQYVDTAGFWLRVNTEPGVANRQLAFDNMNDRPIIGTTDWKKYQLVLDVPKEGYHILYGAYLHGNGQIWFENIKFEVVDSTVAVTGTK